MVERPREDWLEIPVPALVAEDTWHRVQRRLEDNKDPGAPQRVADQLRKEALRTWVRQG